MRLKHIEVSGFRGFATKQTFDLSADAIVVIGANGLGKTSLLDAIHWGLCGQVARFDGGDKNVLSMYSDTGQARVNLTVSQGDRAIKVSRVFDGDSQTIRATIDGQEYSGTSARARLFEEIWPEAASAKDGEASLASALTRSVYLQQDRLREFLEDATGEERFNVIGELVGAGRLTELLAQLESESRSWSRSTTQRNKEMLEPSRERVRNLETQVAKLRHTSQLGDELKETQWDSWWNSAQSLDLEISRSPAPTAADASTSLDKVLRDIQALRDRNKRRRSSIERTMVALKTVPPRSEQAIDELEERAKKATEALDKAKAELVAGQERSAESRKQQLEASEGREQQRALAQLALKLLGDTCPVCGQDYDVAETKRRLQDVIASNEPVGGVQDSTEDSIEKLASLEKEARAKETEAKRKLAEGIRIEEEYAQWRKDCDDKLTDLGVQGDEKASGVLETLLQSTASLEERLKAQISQGEALSLNIARESAAARLKSAEMDLENEKRELAEQAAVVEARETTAVKARRLIDELRDARSNVAIEKLRDIEPLLQRVFARIDPHPTFRVVKLVTNIVRKKGQLHAEIRDSTADKASKIPEVILSSSQLNALAVSMFLSFNLALPKLPLEAALLDDPIQSLDEINLLGLVDLLRHTKQHRQIIVSTHDGRFGRLLARKLRPGDASHTTSVIELRGWKRSGPEVNQFDVEADTTPLRLAAVS